MVEKKFHFFVQALVQCLLCSAIAHQHHCPYPTICIAVWGLKQSL